MVAQAAATSPAISIAERLGPADRIIQTCLAFADHIYHGRPGLVTVDPAAAIGARWQPVTHTLEGDVRVVYPLEQRKAAKGAAKSKGKKGPRLPDAQAAGAAERAQRVRLGVLRDGVVEHEGRIVGRYQSPGLFPEAAAWTYRQVAEVWKLDNEFAGHWASYAWAQDHKDMKVVLAAFMLAQSRFGKPITDNHVCQFYDLNLRDVGRAMLLLPRGDGKHFDAKMVLRARKLLGLPEVAAINRELGFGRSTRTAFLGAWEGTARSWMRQRERNPAMLAGLVKKGFGGTTRMIARTAHYKPDAAAFFAALRWRQRQAQGGHRTMAIGVDVARGDTWGGLDERAICERIVAERLDWKRVVGKLPAAVGVTRAIMAAAIEAGSLSNRDLIIATPTLEELGLLEVQEVKARWDAARKASEDMRAAHIARNVQSAAVKQDLEETADAALQKQVAKAARGLHVYVFVDVSGSMEQSIERAKECLERIVPAFPKEKLHVATFSSQGRELHIPHPSAAGVRQAFAGIRAAGGTDYGAGVAALARHAYVGENVGDGATHDNIFLFVGDEEAQPFTAAVERSGLRPVAFGLLKVPGGSGNCVTHTAARLGIPCFPIDVGMFADAYAIPRTLAALIASTPVVASASNFAAPPPVQRKTLVEQILDTKLLQPPPWA